MLLARPGALTNALGDNKKALEQTPCYTFVVAGLDDALLTPQFGFFEVAWDLIAVFRDVLGCIADQFNR